MRRHVLGPMAFVLLLLVGPAHAGDREVRPCPAPVAEWAGSCAGDAAPAFAAHCPPNHVLFAVGPNGLKVDVSARPDEAFVAAGAFGASPVGDFPDWDRAPAADRAAFDALVGCLRAGAAPVLAYVQATPSRPDPHRAAPSGGSDPRPAARSAGADRSAHGGDAPANARVRGADAPSAPSGRAPVPLRGLLGLGLGLAVALRRYGRAELARRALPLLGLGGGVFAARRLLVPEAWFHQNGQGPFWIHYALGEPSSYGPGFAQLFGAAARGSADPDGAVFLAQGVLCALIPGAAFVIARGVGLSRVVAAGAAVAVSLSPLLARLSASESYFASGGALGMAAAAVLAATVREDSDLRELAGGAVAAALLIAQAALIHPLCWLAAGMIPLVLLVGEGPLGTRAKLSAGAAAAIAVYVLIFAGPGMRAVLEGPLGQQWLAPGGGDGLRSPPLALPGAAALAAVLALAPVPWPRLRRAALGLACLGGLAALSFAINPLGPAAPWVHRAWYWLFAGPLLAAGAAVLREGLSLLPPDDARRPRRELAAALLLVVLAGVGYTAASAETRPVPTDVQEALLVRSWRDALPANAVVAHVERAQNQVVALPLYRRAQVRVFVGQPLADLRTVGQNVYWYRASLCSTARARATCEALEAAYSLRPVHEATLRAVPSMGRMDYDRDVVEVGLYRVVDRLKASTTDEGSSSGTEGR